MNRFIMFSGSSYFEIDIEDEERFRESLRKHALYEGRLTTQTIETTIEEPENGAKKNESENQTH